MTNAQAITRLCRLATLLLGCATLPNLGVLAAADELRQTGQTYNQAQTLQWIDDDRFVLGRWDGTLAVFHTPPAGADAPPAILQTMTTPAASGIEMVAALPSCWLLTSNTANSLAVWRPGGDTYQLHRVIHYPAEAGMFNSGCRVAIGKRAWYASGHANGRVIVWRQTGAGQLARQNMVDVRSPNPIDSPYKIKNVRGIVHWKDSLVITGAEDGDLCLLDILSGQILFRARYNPAAQRGINGLAIAGDRLLVTNCVVGTGERNLWLYRLSERNLTLLDSRYVVSNPAVGDSFSMDSVLIPTADGGCRFLVSTGEGLLWHGKIENDTLQPQGYTVTGPAGVAAVFDFRPTRNALAAADHDIRTFLFIPK